MMVIIIKVLFKTNTTHSSQVAKWLPVATGAWDSPCLTTAAATTSPGLGQRLFSRVLTLELVTSHNGKKEQQKKTVKKITFYGNERTLFRVKEPVK